MYERLKKRCRAGLWCNTLYEDTHEKNDFNKGYVLGKRQAYISILEQIKKNEEYIEKHNLIKKSI